MPTASQRPPDGAPRPGRPPRRRGRATVLAALGPRSRSPSPSDEAAGPFERIPGAVTAKCGVYTLVDERPAKFDSWPLNQSPNVAKDPNRAGFSRPQLLWELEQQVDAALQMPKAAEALTLEQRGRRMEAFFRVCEQFGRHFPAHTEVLAALARECGAFIAWQHSELDALRTQNVRYAALREVSSEDEAEDDPSRPGRRRRRRERENVARAHDEEVRQLQDIAAKATALYAEKQARLDEALAAIQDIDKSVAAMEMRMQSLRSGIEKCRARPVQQQTLDSLTGELWQLHRNFSALEARHLQAVDDVAELHIMLREPPDSRRSTPATNTTPSVGHSPTSRSRVPREGSLPGAEAEPMPERKPSVRRVQLREDVVTHLSPP